MRHLGSFVLLKIRLFTAFGAAEGWPASVAHKIRAKFIMGCHKD